MEECIACYLVGSPKNSAQEERISRPFIVPGDTDALVCKHKKLDFWKIWVGRNWEAEPVDQGEAQVLKIVENRVFTRRRGTPICF